MKVSFLYIKKQLKIRIFISISSGWGREMTGCTSEVYRRKNAYAWRWTSRGKGGFQNDRRVLVLIPRGEVRTTITCSQGSEAWSRTLRDRGQIAEW